MHLSNSDGRFYLVHDGIQAQNCTRHKHKKVCSDQRRRSGNRHVDLHVLPIIAQRGQLLISNTSVNTVSVGLLQSNDVSGMFRSQQKFSDGRTSRSYFKRAWVGQRYLTRIHTGSNKRWYPMTGYVFCFLLMKPFSSEKVNTKKYCFRWSPSVVVHSSCYPIGKSSGRCPKHRGGPWTTPRSAIANESVWLQRRQSDHRLCQLSALGKSSAVLTGRSDGASPVRLSLRVCHECDRFFSDNTFGKPPPRTNCVEDRPRFTHAFPRAWRWDALGQLWIWCDWCEVSRLKAATLVNKVRQALA